MVDALKILLLPPVNLILMLIAGLALRRRRSRLGVVLIVGSIAAFYGLSTPVVSSILTDGLEDRSALPLDSLPTGTDAPQAIVVLAAGRRNAAPDYAGSDTVGPLTLERLRHAARVHRQTGLPVLVAGGGTPDEVPPLADLMARSLAEDFGIEATWRETRSLNTAENAFFSAAILGDAGIDRVYLVTHAWHMRRAGWVFDVAGLTVVPAPTAFAGRGDDSALEASDFVASPAHFLRSSLALHEWLGLVWYRLRYGTDLDRLATS